MRRRLKRILVHVPEKFLERFDREIEGIYASRNEAIRAGMIMVLENIRKGHLAGEGFVRKVSQVARLRTS